MLELLVHRVEDGSHLTGFQPPKVVNRLGRIFNSKWQVTADVTTHGYRGGVAFDAYRAKVMPNPVVYSKSLVLRPGAGWFK